MLAPPLQLPMVVSESDTPRSRPLPQHVIALPELHAEAVTFPLAQARRRSEACVALPVCSPLGDYSWLSHRFVCGVDATRATPTCARLRMSKDRSSSIERHLFGVLIVRPMLSTVTATVTFQLCVSTAFCSCVQNCSDFSTQPTGKHFKARPPAVE